MRYGRKIGEENVEKLLVDREDGFTLKQLIERYGISETTILNILRERQAHREDNKQGLRVDLKPLKEPAECGTPAGHARHIRHKTPVCIPCANAHNLRKRRDRMRKKFRSENAKKNQPKMLWQADWK